MEASEIGKNQMEKAARKAWFELASFGLGNCRQSSRL